MEMLLCRLYICIQGFSIELFIFQLVNTYTRNFTPLSRTDEFCLRTDVLVIFNMNLDAIIARGPRANPARTNRVTTNEVRRLIINAHNFL